MKIALIYLAAGNSRRFGSNKLFYEINGKPMYRHLLDRLIHIADKYNECEICVVTRYEEIRFYVEKMKKQGGKIRWLWSPDSEKGISYSIRAGICAAWYADASVFFVADQPFLTEDSVENFLRFMKNVWEHERIWSLGSVCSKGLPGNPVWFGQAYYPELKELQGDQGGRKVFCRYPERIKYYELAEITELTDLDDKKEENI